MVDGIRGRIRHVHTSSRRDAAVASAEATCHDRVRVRLRRQPPAPSRRYDVLLGGKDNFAADRSSAKEIREELPAGRELRAFLHRAVTFLAAGCGISSSSRKCLPALSVSTRPGTGRTSPPAHQ